MLTRLARLLVRRRRVVLVATLVTVVASGVLGAGVADDLTAGGFDDPDAPSSRATRVLAERFDEQEPNFVLVVTAEWGTVDDPRVREAGLALSREVDAEEHIDGVLSHWTFGGDSPLVSRDRTRALIVAQITGDDDAVDDRVAVLADRYTRDGPVLDVAISGFAQVFSEVGDTIEEDLARSEAIAFPVTLLLLVLVFGSVVAASLPLAIGGIAILGTFLLLRMIAQVTPVSIFALNMVTAMGLGLAIDYALFVVSRFREEMEGGAEVSDAVVRTVETAGRTVLFSGITVAVSLSALLVFPLPFLRSFAYAGIGVVATAVLGAVVFLPAGLAALGPRVDRWVLFRWRRRATGEGFWHRVATFVMRRPIPVATVVVAFLLLLGAPFLRVEFGLPDDRVLPPGAPVREATDILREEFSGAEAAALRVVAVDIGDVADRKDDIDGYAAALSSLPGASRVDAPTGTFEDGQKVADASFASVRFVADEAVWFSVVPTEDPLSARSERLVDEVRSSPAPFDEVLVGGPSAELVDSKDALFGVVPLAGALIGIATFVLLFVMFGSLLVPAKALVLNVLSLTATFGAMVWVFQEGHLSGILGFTATGSLVTTIPILMFCVAFGLSMDYEVFLLSRIREEYDRTGDDVGSVAVGLEKTGRIVTAAALLISVVFLATATSGVRFIKLFGVGMALAVLMDAFVIRGTLVPAFMRLAGRANWWLPAGLKRVYQRFRISHEPGDGGGP